MQCIDLLLSIANLHRTHSQARSLGPLAHQVLSSSAAAIVGVGALLQALENSLFCCSPTSLEGLLPGWLLREATALLLVLRAGSAPCE